MFKNISKTIARTALVASFGMLSIAAAQADEVSPEVGHISSSWWQDSSAPHSTEITTFAVDTNNSEIGHISWDWWSHNVHADDNSQASLSSSELTSETGHVSWQWWNEKTAI